MTTDPQKMQDEEIARAMDAGEIKGPPRPKLGVASTQVLRDFVSSAKDKEARRLKLAKHLAGRSPTSR